MVLDRRALNRALLERQLLLERRHLPALEAIRHLVGLQSQAPGPPYVGLWSRLADFSFDELAELITDRKAVRVALLRGTIFLVDGDDCLRLRPLMNDFLVRNLWATHGTAGLTGADLAEVAAAGRAAVEAEPLTFKRLGEALAGRWPDSDPRALVLAVRATVPLVQVPPRGLWGRSGQSAHTSAESWLGRPLSGEGTRAELVRRYLAAFGPATVKDVQTWSSLTGLGEVVERLRPELRTYRDEHGRELFDVPDGPLPDPTVPAPVRLVAGFDNMLLSHADRARVISEADRGRVFTVNGIIRPTVLVDGFVHGKWDMKAARGTATLTVDLFRPVTEADRAAIHAEATALLAAAHPGAEPTVLVSAGR
ncbi:winged helix DNA-binding domain-containing protein [Actinomadura craniellae]|nr:winged helix DNA-binding domain-containing protein [Actinomadura craniellae]